MARNKTNLLGKRISKFFREEPLISKLFIALILLFAAQFVYFYKENQDLKRQVLAANTKVSEVRLDLDNIEKVVVDVSTYFEEKGNLTLAGLIEIVSRQEDTIDTLNNNVKVANDNSTDLYNKTSSLQRQVDIIADYLFR